ncbi:50S ribosomal protein L3, partial [Acinetobacter baumannii]|nr:50S ribosomal protein L3 [Acinetobacter baumannii]
MTKGILGRKIGMTQVFAENGELIPVTVIAVLQKKTTETDGYNAIQLGFEDKREKLTNKPEQGHTAKASTTPKRFIREIRDADVDGLEVGQEVKVDVFATGEIVDVTGISKGK